MRCKVSDKDRNDAIDPMLLMSHLNCNAALPTVPEVLWRDVSNLNAELIKVGVVDPCRSVVCSNLGTDLADTTAYLGRRIWIECNKLLKHVFQSHRSQEVLCFPGTILSAHKGCIAHFDGVPHHHQEQSTEQLSAHTLKNVDIS